MQAFHRVNDSDSYTSHSLFIEPTTFPIDKPCGDYGEFVTRQDLSDSTQVGLICVDLREAIAEKTVPIANYYGLATEGQDHFKMGSPVYGCSINFEYGTHRYPALCKALETVPNRTVFAFSAPYYRGDRPFEGRPKILRPGEEFPDVTDMASFKFTGRMEVVVYEQPNFQGRAQTLNVSTPNLSFPIRSVQVRNAS